MIINVKTLLVLTSLLYFAESVTFHCDFGKVILFYDESYTCSASVEQSYDETILTNVQGAHQDNLSNADVLALDVSHQIFNVLPRNLATFFPNLEAISIHDCTLARVAADDLQSFPNLLFFRVWVNKLVSLDGNLFQYNPRLRIVDFEANLIEIVGKNLLAHLSDLVMVDFNNNRCISTYADTPEAIQALNDLLPVRCSESSGVVFECYFTYSDWESIRDPIYTCRAYMLGRSNVLVDVIGDHYQGRSNSDVRALSIRFQKHNSIIKNIASFFPDLQVLGIDNCDLLTISAADLEPFPNLIHLGVLWNFLESLESNLFMHNRHLRYIDFDANLLERVGVNLLRDLTQLEVADFSRNPCVDIKASTSQAIQELNNILPIQCPKVHFR